MIQIGGMPRPGSFTLRGIARAEIEAADASLHTLGLRSRNQLLTAAIREQNEALDQPGFQFQPVPVVPEDQQLKTQAVIDPLVLQTAGENAAKLDIRRAEYIRGALHRYLLNVGTIATLSEVPTSSTAASARSPSRARADARAQRRVKAAALPVQQPAPQPAEQVTVKVDRDDDQAVQNAIARLYNAVSRRAARCAAKARKREQGLVKLYPEPLEPATRELVQALRAREQRSVQAAIDDDIDARTLKDALTVHLLSADVTRGAAVVTREGGPVCEANPTERVATNSNDSSTAIGTCAVRPATIESAPADSADSATATDVTIAPATRTERPLMFKNQSEVIKATRDAERDILNVLGTRTMGVDAIAAELDASDKSLGVKRIELTLRSKILQLAPGAIKGINKIRRVHQFAQVEGAWRVATEADWAREVQSNESRDRRAAHGPRTAVSIAGVIAPPAEQAELSARSSNPHVRLDSGTIGTLTPLAARPG